MDFIFFKNEIPSENAIKEAVAAVLADISGSEKRGDLVRIREHPRKGRMAWRLDLPGGKTAFIKSDDLSIKGRWLHRFHFLHPFYKEARVLSDIQNAGITTPIPIMVGFDPGRFFPARAFLATLALDEYEPLGKTIGRRLGCDPDLPAELREDWPLTLAKLFAGLHKTGFYHRDLQKDHLLWRREKDQIEWAMVDLEGAFIKKPLPMWYRIKSLYMIGRHLLKHSPPEDTIHFIREYNRVCFPGADPNPLIKAALLYARFRQEGRAFDGKKDKSFADYLRFARRHWRVPFLRLILSLK